MAATHEDRNAQLSPGVAIKTPCRAATTAAITLSTEQTVDGVALVSGDRVLVKDQADQTTNGIYLVSTGSWTREPDFDGNRDVVKGTFVFITNGAINAGAFYECTAANPVIIGTSLLTFAQGALGPIAIPISATNVTFTPAGAGAVARSVADDLADRNSVFRFFTAAQKADVLAGTALLDVGAAITTALASITTGTLWFPSGTYAYATSPNFAKANLSIVCGQLTTFKHTGSGTAFTLDAGANPAFINGMNIENIYVLGNVNSTRGIYARGIGRSTFKNIIVTSLGPTAEALREDFCLLNTWINFKVSLPGPAPKYGIYLTRRDVGENTTAETFINPCIESVSTAGGSGIFLDWASTNTFIGGTSEANDTGIWLTANAVANTFYNTDLEGNAVRDINCLGPDNTFVKPISAGAVLVSGASALRNTFLSPYFTTVTFDAACARTSVFGGVVKTSATDSSTTTTWLGVYNANAASPVPAYIHGGINVFDGNVVLANSLQLPSPRTGTSATDTITSADSAFIANRAGTITLTLESAAAVPGRQLPVRTIQAQTVVSASSNVVPLIGGAAGTAILAATAGKWAVLQSDGAAWQIMAGN